MREQITRKFEQATKRTNKQQTQIGRQPRTLNDRTRDRRKRANTQTNKPTKKHKQTKQIQPTPNRTKQNKQTNMRKQ